MDPLVRRYRRHSRPAPSFPRTRGDGPVPSRCIVEIRVSPQMDPDHGPGRILRCFPRTRGDGPLRTPCRSRNSPRLGFPRTRGDGPGISVGCGRFAACVSPARAGMDPGAGVTIRDLVDWFPPHARGWTVVAECEDGESRNLVSPARAGMDPRGSLQCTYMLSDTVSPARAGMDPASTMDAMALLAVGFPRTRGDGPATIGLGRPLQEGEPFPPHARGWTDMRVA